jgi:hypothetical protein
VSLPALLAAALLLAPACSPAPPRQSQGPRLAAEPERFDFGDVLPGRSLSKEFTLRNVGSAPLLIEKLASSCACTALLLGEDARRLAPGRSAPLRVTLTTPAQEGPLLEKVQVSTNDPERSLVELEIAANVKPGR